MSQSASDAPRSRCPICGKPVSERHRPFCSQRCATIDLARWITGAYRVPEKEGEEAEGVPGEAEES